MKRSPFIILLVSTLIVVDLPAEVQARSRTADPQSVSIGRKRKGFKPRRGGLFNTGLFRKKNPCGCPNH